MEEQLAGLESKQVELQEALGFARLQSVTLLAEEKGRRLEIAKRVVGCRTPNPEP